MSGAIHRRTGLAYSPHRAELNFTKSLPTTVGVSRTRQTAAVSTANQGTMPPLKEENIKLENVTLQEVKDSLQWLWTNGGPGGQAAVNAFASATWASKVEVKRPEGGGVMQAGSSFLGLNRTLSVPPFPATDAERLRWGSQFAHEMMHMTTEQDRAGTSRGEVNAYLTEYKFYKDLGYGPDQIRGALGDSSPAYLIGTMADVYGINPSTKAFVSFAKDWLGVGGSMGGTFWLPRNSSSPSFGASSLSTQQLAEIAGDIHRGTSDIRHLTDDPNSTQR